MKWLLRVFAFPLLIMVLSAVGYGVAYVFHEMKPSMLEYQKTVIASGEARKVYLVNLGWHTDIVVRISDIDANILPEKRYFPDYEYVAIGWGDAAFYPAKEMPPQFILKTLFSPTETVMHLAAFSVPPKDAFSYTDVMPLHVSKQGFDKMMQTISSSFSREGTVSAAPLRDGLYGKSYFFAASGSYHALNNCNHWTAKALASADIPFNVWSAINAGNVIWQAKRFESDS